MTQRATTALRIDSQVAIDLLSELDAIAGGYLKAVPTDAGLEEARYLVRVLVERQRQVLGSLLDAMLEGTLVDGRVDAAAANDPLFDDQPIDRK